MKIAIVTDAWHPQINGVVTTYHHTVDELRRRNYQTAMITPAQFFSVPCPGYPEIMLALSRPKRLAALLVDFAPNAVHIATEGPLGWMARAACLSAGFPFTSAYHTRFPEYLRLRFPLPIRFSYFILRLFHKRAAQVMVASTGLKAELETRGFHKLALWSRGVDTKLFKPLPLGTRPRKERQFIYVGRVAPEKNIEAFLSLDLPGRKVVVGNGPDLKRLRRHHPEVLFCGYQQGRDLADLIASSDVFVFPSKTDTFGIVQLEAMACGIPVAAFPVEGPQSLIRNGVNGCMHHDLKTAVINCLSVCPENCRQYALRYSWQAATDQFLNNLYMQEIPFTLSNPAPQLPV